MMRAPQRRIGEHPQPGLGRIAMVDQGHAATAGKAGPCARGAHLVCGGTDAQPVGVAEDAARFIGVANERSDRVAAREDAADDLAADGRWRRSLRWSSCLLRWLARRGATGRLTPYARAHARFR